MSPNQQRPGPLRSLSDILGMSASVGLGDIAQAATTPQRGLLDILASLGSSPAPLVIRER
jgi:hypothetical protein